MSKPKIIVIGAGAAGIMAAGRAANSGADVTVFEKMNQPGRKLRITGKGRCNITNIATIQDFISHFGKSGKFLRQAFSAFFNDDLMRFFNEHGVETVTERGGRVFPASNEAEDVVNALLEWNRKSGVQILTSAQVNGLVIENGIFKGITLKNYDAEIKAAHNNNITTEADSVIVATGGASYPATGSTGDGYMLAGNAGHKIIGIRPALVPLITEGSAAVYLQGLSLKNINASIRIPGEKTKSQFGDMLFTDKGVSGPVILTLSGRCVDALNAKKAIMLYIDLKPALDHQKLDQRILRDIKDSPNKAVKNLLRALLPERLIDVCLDFTGIMRDKPANQITSDERKRLRVWLKEFPLEITGYASFNEAIITAGGVDTKEIDPRTMESRLVKGLYFAGEVIDIDADTGGYNLQAAFSTGWLAGKSAAMNKE